MLEGTGAGEMTMAVMLVMPVSIPMAVVIDVMRLWTLMGMTATLATPTVATMAAMGVGTMVVEMMEVGGPMMIMAVAATVGMGTAAAAIMRGVMASTSSLLGRRTDAPADGTTSASQGTPRGAEVDERRCISWHATAYGYVLTTFVLYMLLACASRRLCGRRVILSHFISRPPRAGGLPFGEGRSRIASHVMNRAPRPVWIGTLKSGQLTRAGRGGALR